MNSFNVYLTFAGNCEEAINFYKECIGGEIIYRQTFGEGPIPVDENYKSKILHIELKSEGVLLMASDSMPGQPVMAGNNISLSLNFTDENEQEVIFNKLSAGGKVTMPLENTFWGAKFGMLTDKYGFNWMLNCTKPA